MVKARDFVTRSGVKLQVLTHDDARLLGETETVSGTTPDWVSVEARFTVPPGVSLVRVQVRREPAPTPEANLGGKVWLDAVRLTPDDGAET